MTRLRAVILADFADQTGGAQSVALQSARGLAEAGVDVTYVHSIAGTADPLLDHPGIDRVSLGLADVWERPALAAARDGIWNRSAARSLTGILGRLPAGPVVLHLHQWTRGFSPSILPVLARTGWPVAVTLHDYFLACPNGLYYRFDRDAPCSVTPFSPACLLAPCDPKSPRHKLIRVLRSAATALALKGRPLDLIHVSDRGRDTIAPFLPDRMRHHRIDNPVQSTPGPAAAIGPDTRITYLGRLTREKGADLVAQAAARAGVSALLIGDGPLADEIRASHPGAEVLGWRSADEVAALLRDRVRALVAPSRWFETGPLTVYEGQAAGLPVVVSNRAGASEKIADGETGFVVAPEVEALAQAFLWLQDLDVARRLGQEAYRRYWLAPPTRAAHARRLVTLYENMLQGDPARAPQRVILAPQ
ncbi:MAG TPA: glycosyltransferase [Beijerinckiaceae bacterium]|jgi:glycosyltransferase involved in cell wall biosynthesis